MSGINRVVFTWRHDSELRRSPTISRLVTWKP
jgi:hypothetical protein